MQVHTMIRINSIGSLKVNGRGLGRLDIVGPEEDAVDMTAYICATPRDDSPIEHRLELELASDELLALGHACVGIARLMKDREQLFDRLLGGVDTD